MCKVCNGRYNGCRNIVGKIVQNLENGNWELYSYFENIKASIFLKKEKYFLLTLI